MTQDDKSYLMAPFKDILDITTLFDIIINQNDIIDQNNTSFWLDNTFIIIQNNNQDSIHALLKRGVKKFVFDINESNQIKVQPQYYALVIYPDNFVKFNTKNCHSKDIIFAQNDEDSIKKIENFLGTNKLENVNLYLIVESFTTEELQLVKKFNLRPLVQLNPSFDLDNVQEWFLELFFNNNDKLISTIVQDPSKNILMQAYSNRISLEKAIKEKKGIYFSRSRKQLWTKGETSGNSQTLLKVRYDCDFDSLIFTVEQTGNACHTNSYSCFNINDFDFNTLYTIIEGRRDSYKDNSYTSKLLQDEKMIMDKIKEESLEVINYRDRDNLVWELGDIFYFLQVLMVKKNITLTEVFAELRRRNVLNVK